MAVWFHTSRTRVSLRSIPAAHASLRPQACGKSETWNSSFTTGHGPFLPCPNWHLLLEHVQVGVDRAKLPYLNTEVACGATTAVATSSMSCSTTLRPRSWYLPAGALCDQNGL
eukprot:668490-Rhodomonas_salina.7